MILLTLENTEDFIVVTLTEKATIESPYYRFVFTHIETRQEVVKVFTPEEELSGYTERYNKFEINTADVFEGKPDGEWKYKVYEQETEDGESEEVLLEEGKMQLVKNRGTVYTTHTAATTFTVYNG